MVFGLFKNRRWEQAAYGLYGALVDQARQPDFYTELGVADTVDGRFDMIALHAALVIRRLQRISDSGPKVSQEVFDLMFADMDRNLREMGVTDLGVGKQVKRMATAFYGRAEAYEEAWSSADVAGLEAALRRNLFRNMEPADWQVAAIGVYTRRVIDYVDQQDDVALLDGKIAFPPVLADPIPTGDVQEGQS